MTYTLADSMRMKLRNHPFSVEQAKPRIFENSDYEHPWYTHLNKPKPPTEEAKKKAKFVDKTYTWQKK